MALALVAMAHHPEAAVDLARRKVVLGGTAALSLSCSKMTFGGIPDPFLVSWPDGLPPLNDPTGRTLASVSINPAKRNLILLIEGQSLAAATIVGSYTVLNPSKIINVNWAGDRLAYQHQEPMLGPSFGDPASYITLWGKCFDLLIARGFDMIIAGNTCVAGEPSSALAPGGILGHRVPTFFNVLSSLGIRGNQVSAIISMEGEADGALGTAGDVFKSNRRATRRAAASFGFTGPMFVPVESWRGIPSQTYPVIQQAQAELGAESGFAPGPNFDVLGLTYRDDTLTHLNSPLGRDTAAQMWADTIAARFL